MYPNPSGRKRIACSAFYEVVQNRYTPSSANFKESLTAGLPLKKPETLSNCVGPLLNKEREPAPFINFGHIDEDGFGMRLGMRYARFRTGLVLVARVGRFF